MEKWKVSEELMRKWENDLTGIKYLRFPKARRFLYHELDESQFRRLMKVWLKKHLEFNPAVSKIVREKLEMYEWLREYKRVFIDKKL